LVSGGKEEYEFQKSGVVEDFIKRLNPSRRAAAYL